MAGKEAVVYVVDVGESMGSVKHGRDQTDLEWSLRYVWDKIAADVGTGRKTLQTGLIAFRADETEHEMPKEDAYEHISVLQPIKQTLMPDVRTLTQKLKTSHTDDGDAFSALATALQMITQHCGKLKWKKRIVMVTNGTGFMDASDLREMANKINEDGMELVILGADFDDLDYGFEEEDKQEQKAANENTLHKLADDCNGLFGSLNQAVAELDIPRVKETKPVRSYQGFLTLGLPEQYETAMAIDVERYPRTMVKAPPAASTFVSKSEPGADEIRDVAMNGDDQPNGDDGLASVKNLRAYQVKDEDAPGGKRDVEREELSKGFEYGATVVPVSEHDMSVFNMETTATFEILGFVPVESHPHYMNMDRTNFVIPLRNNEKAVLALSVLIHALYELDSHAVARLVPKHGKEPLLVLLSYEINPEFECLYENALPFHEDVRSYKFPPLDRIITVSGKVMTMHRNLPDDNLQQSMDDLVDSMDLSQYDRDDEGNPTEYLPMDETYSPIYHRLNQVIKHRAVFPEGAIPPPTEAVLKGSRPPEELLEKVVSQLERLQAAADVKKVPPKTAFRKQKRTTEQPRSGLDVSALLGSSKSESKISSTNAIPEFKRSLDAATTTEQIKESFTQFGPIIEGWIKDSFGDSGYERAVEGIRNMREEGISMEEPELYNDFMRSLKSKLLTEQLGGDRQEMWFKLRVYKLGLLDKKTSASSTVTEEEEAQHFLSAR